MMVLISYTYPPNPPRTFMTEAREITLGRFTPNQQVDLDLNPDLQVSHLHARIVEDDGSYWIEDLGSRNGTWVNGERIAEKTPITTDDALMIGQTTLALEAKTADLLEEHPTLDPTDPHYQEGIFASRLLAAESPSVLMLPVAVQSSMGRRGPRADAETLDRVLRSGRGTGNG
jgi:pSer/pThr/pTyr-binding forkhead associated (FHA) protein